MAELLSNRTLRAYLVILVGATLFMARRLVFPTFFETSGVPFNIAVPSNLNACYTEPRLLMCSDAVVVALTVLGVIVALGWGSPGITVFAIMLAIPPLVLYFALSPIWAPLLALAFIPLALEVGLRWLVPPPPTESS
jgi:hypothetical protein